MAYYLNGNIINKPYKQPFADVIQRDALKNFTIFTGKYIFWSLQHSCFSVNIANFLRTASL